MFPRKSADFAGRSIQSRFGLRVRVQQLDPFAAVVPSGSVYIQFCLLLLVWVTMDSAGLSVTSVPLPPPALSVRYIPTSGMLVT